ncbi:LITAF-like zinc ribbon domain-containing protein [Lactonifactor longoviformis]|uniref:LITAF-like zinc ribbon domain-containing protein n=1 Tax=Lactonifactor longoviformis TaxID=341220 RepID=UPI0036F26F1F
MISSIAFQIFCSQIRYSFLDRIGQCNLKLITQIRTGPGNSNFSVSLFLCLSGTAFCCLFIFFLIRGIAVTASYCRKCQYSYTYHCK